MTISLFKQEWWTEYFDRVIRRLRTRGLDVLAYRANTDKWHAKIAIRHKDDKPVAAIIGSSNLTGPAFREGSPGRWNYECDVTIWKNDKALNDVFAKPPPGVDDLDYASAILNTEIRQVDEVKRLQTVLNDLREDEDILKYEPQEE